MNFFRCYNFFRRHFIQKPFSGPQNIPIDIQHRCLADSIYFQRHTNRKFELFHFFDCGRLGCTQAPRKMSTYTQILMSMPIWLFLSYYLSSRRKNIFKIGSLSWQGLKNVFNLHRIIIFFSQTPPHPANTSMSKYKRLEKMNYVCCHIFFRRCFIEKPFREPIEYYHRHSASLSRSQYVHPKAHTTKI